MSQPDTSSHPAALACLQGHLYDVVDPPGSLDASVQWLAVRDFLQEAEVAAGMIQRLLAEQAELRLADIGLLLPDSPEYASAVREVFGRAGLPLSGLVEPRSVRDLGREAVFYLLLALHKPAPVMALAAFLSSPLLPWGRGTGLDLAQAVIDGDFRLEKICWPETGQQLLRQVVAGAANPEAMAEVLRCFEKLLPRDEELADAVTAARNALHEVETRLQGQSGIAWEALLKAAAPNLLEREVEGEVSREGIAVCSESAEPWRPVRQLFVLGFNAGHFPRDTGVSPVFSEADLQRLKSAGIILDSAADQSRQRRERFRRQLGMADTAMHFLLSRRDALGKPLAPSASLTFMAQLFGVKEPEELICELDTAEGRVKARSLSHATDGAPTAPRELTVADLDLGRDLLVAILKRTDGSQYPLSPSGLETLMVSPLAWVLGKADLEPRAWAPEELDVASKGTLAHAVFEHLFTLGGELPDAESIRARVPGLLSQAFVAIKPFMRGEEWRVERNHLESEIIVAALRWREILDQLGAKVLGVEVWLEGHLDGNPLHGAADLLLGLPDGRLFVVDYKKSKSKKRKERMQARFDSQASLYRIMLETGGISSRKSPDVDASVKQAKEIGVLYFLLNDQIALTDTTGWLADAPDGVEELACDVSSEALKLIRQRLAEIKAGQVKLNSVEDDAWFDKNAGLKIYALDNSPLLRLFMHSSREEVCP